MIYDEQSFRAFRVEDIAAAARDTINRIQRERDIMKANALADAMKPWRFLFWTFSRSEEDALEWIDDDYADFRWYAQITLNTAKSLLKIAEARSDFEEIFVSAEDFRAIQGSYYRLVGHAENA